MCKERNKSKPHSELREFKFGYCCQFQYAWRLADLLEAEENSRYTSTVYGCQYEKKEPTDDTSIDV